MIQRIQTIYLLFAAIATSLTFWLSFAAVQAPADGSDPFVNGSLDINDHLALLVSAIAAASLPFLNIFLFNNRRLQMLICKLSMLVEVVFIGLIAYLLFSAGLPFSVGIGVFMPLLSLILLVFANSAIRKDEELVKSMDRIR